VIRVRTRRRLRRWLGWVIVAVGVIGLAHPDLPGAVPLLIGVALLQGGSGRIRRLLRHVDGWWREARRRVLNSMVSLGPFTVPLNPSEEPVVEAGAALTVCHLLGF
jgi:hypothetical protein